MLAEFNRFKMEDVPPRLEIKQRLLRLFEEIQVSRDPAFLNVSQVKGTPHLITTSRFPDVNGSLSTVLLSDSDINIHAGASTDFEIRCA